MQSPIVCVHLDLKGMVHRPEYWPQFMADLAGQGINALLVEYEDVFPFTGIDVAYDRSTILAPPVLGQFLAAAKANGIEIIPLQQCLGHLEYVFRWPRYAAFAEPECYPSTLALASSAGRKLVLQMLEQVIAAHPDSRFIHLGMDEAHGLKHAADQSGRSILDLYVEWIEALLDVTERHGRRAIVWSDMLEDHFDRALIERLRGRLVLNTWDYESKTGRSPACRLQKRRVSRLWLNEPDNPDAPAIGAGSLFIEDLPDDLLDLLAPYRHGRLTDTFFQVNMWTRLGFDVLGAAAIRSSSHGAVMPRFHDLFGNISGFAKAICDDAQLGVIGTSWARGNTFCPNNFPIELAWPAVAVLGGCMGGDPVSFYGDIDASRLDLLLRQLGRSRKDWSLETPVLAELIEMTPTVTAHRFEWDCLLLMVRVFELHRHVDFVFAEMDYFASAARPTPAEWQRRLDDQEQAGDRLATLRREVAVHFGQRYHGEHFEEWLRDLFDVRIEKLRRCSEQARASQAAAIDRYRD